MSENRRAQFWQGPVWAALIICLIVFGIAAFIQLMTLSDSGLDQRQRRGFYTTLAGQPISDEDRSNADVIKGIIAAQGLQKFLEEKVPEGAARLDSFSRFSDLAAILKRYKIPNNPLAVKKILLAKPVEKNQILTEILTPASHARAWKIAGLIYWLGTAFAVSITYFLQCRYYDYNREDFWKVPYGKLGTYLIILGLLPGLIACLVVWLFIKAFGSDLKAIRKRKVKKPVNLEIESIQKAKDDLERLRQKI